MSVSTQVAMKDAASRKLARIAAAYEKMERAARMADIAATTAGTGAAINMRDLCHGKPK